MAFIPEIYMQQARRFEQVSLNDAFREGIDPRITEMALEVEASIDEVLNEFNAFLETPMGIHLQERCSLVGTEYLDSQVKRDFDKKLSNAAIIPAYIVGYLVAGIVKLSGQDGVILEQERLGKGGEPVVIKKIRTMVNGAHRLKTPLKIWEDFLTCPEEDDRATPIGRIIRKAHLDEFLQFANVRRGELSIVGIRILPMEYLITLEKVWSEELHTIWAEAYLSARPGLLGFTQVASPYPNFDPLRYIADMTYMQNASLALDVFLVMRTFKYMMEKAKRKANALIARSARISASAIEEQTATY